MRDYIQFGALITGVALVVLSLFNGVLTIQPIGQFILGVLLVAVTHE